MVNFHHRFLPHCAMLLAPLNNLLAVGDAAKKSTKKVNSSNLVIDWTDSTKAAFQVVKDALSNATLLVHPIANALTNIMVDASDTAGGGVLQQYQGSVWKPLAFFSKKLQVPEKKYSAFDRELLTVKHFRPFLGGRIFHILSGHKPLTYCLSANSERSSPRQIRQLAYISEFTSDIRHISGSENLPADALSRLVVDAIGNVVDLDYDKLAIAQTNDCEIQRYLKNPGGLRLRQLEVPKSQSKLWCDISTGKPRPFLPSAFRRSAYERLYDLSHPGIKATKKLVAERFVWPKMNSHVVAWARSCIECQRAKITRHFSSPLASFTLPDLRFDTVPMDIVGPLTVSQGQRYLLTCVDRLPGGPRLFPFMIYVQILLLKRFLMAG